MSPDPYRSNESGIGSDAAPGRLGSGQPGAPRTRGLRCRPAVLLAAVFLGGAICFTSMEAQDNPETTAGGGHGANAVEASGILPRIDALLTGLEARIMDIRAQAEQILDYADATSDSDDQMRLEEMYGNLAAAAEKLEEQRDNLRSMRDELAAAGQRP